MSEKSEHNKKVFTCETLKTDIGTCINYHSVNGSSCEVCAMMAGPFMANNVTF